MNVEASFAEKFVVSGECWVWTASTTKDGYGHLWDGERVVLAHRWSYENYVGSPDGLNVLHSCDNPPCVNPAHLFAGSQGDNVRDCLEKGRRSPQAGENNHAAKLTSAQVEEIRSRATGEWGEQTRLAAEYGVSQAHVSSILKGEVW